MVYEYQVFPRVAPLEGSFSIDKIQEIDSHIPAGEGRSIGTQALMQLLGKVKTEFGKIV